MHVTKITKKKKMSPKFEKECVRDIWEGSEEGKRRERRCNFIRTSKKKTKNQIQVMSSPDPLQTLVIIVKTNILLLNFLGVYSE